MTIQHKTFDIERKDGWIVASTPAVDRDGDRVVPGGLDLENYRRNPVLLYGHNYADPFAVIGKAAEIVVDEMGMRILPELREPATDNDPMHIIKALWEQGLLRAASIGFKPLQSMGNAYGGKDITQAELLEISLVPIPANQTALRLAAKSLGDEPHDEPHDEQDEIQEAQQKDGEVQTEAPAEGEVKEAAPEEEEALPEAGQDSPTAEMSPEQELRFAAILAQFIESLRPYLPSGV